MGSDHSPGELARTDAGLIEAESGYATLEAWPDHSFAPILLDVNRPDMDDFEVASLGHRR
jgi:CheY-like chemotaxis protein